MFSNIDAAYITMRTRSCHQKVTWNTTQKL